MFDHLATSQNISWKSELAWQSFLRTSKTLLLLVSWSDHQTFCWARADVRLTMFDHLATSQNISWKSELAWQSFLRTSKTLLLVSWSNHQTLRRTSRCLIILPSRKKIFDKQNILGQDSKKTSKSFCIWCKQTGIR